MSQKSLTEVATNRLVIVISECLSVRQARLRISARGSCALAL